MVYRPNASPGASADGRRDRAGLERGIGGRIAKTRRARDGRDRWLSNELVGETGARSCERDQAFFNASKYAFIASSASLRYCGMRLFSAEASAAFSFGASRS